MFQVLFNFFGAFLFLPLFYIEISWHIPLIKRLVGVMTQDIAQQMANVYLLFNFLAAVVLSLLTSPVHKLLAQTWPPTDEEDQAKVQFIHDQALNDPETAMDLVEKEHVRLMKRLPQYIEDLRVDKLAQQRPSWATKHQSFITLAMEVESFLTDLIDQSLPHITSERLLNMQNRHSVVVSIEENVYRLAATLEQSTGSEALHRLMQNFIEGLDALLLTAIDAIESSDMFDIEILISVAADRGELMERIRQMYLSSGGALAPQEQSLLLYITNLFERTVWMLRRWGELLASAQKYAPA